MDRSGERTLVRPHEYVGQQVVTINACPTLGPRMGRAERAEVIRGWLAFFEGETAIRELTLSCRVTDSLLRAVASQQQLEKLTLRGGPYTDLSVLTALAGLRDLRLGGATAVSALDPLGDLRGLETLHVEDARRVHNFSPLAALPSLTELFVTRGINGARWDVDSVEFLAELPALRRLIWDPRVTDRDFSALLALKDAEEIAINPTKGMQPTIVDLEWNLPGVQTHNARVAARRIRVISASGETAILATDVTGKQTFVSPNADDLSAGEVEFEIPRGFRGLVTGTTYRTFSRTPRTRIEQFRARIDAPKNGLVFGIPAPERIIGEYAFAGPIAGPLLVWDSSVDIADTVESIKEFFAGNVDGRDTGAWASPPTLDITSAPLLDASDCWRYLAPLADGVTGEAVRGITDRLAENDDEYVCSWIQTLDTLAVNLRPSIAHLQDRLLLHDSDTFCAVGAILCRGQSTYQEVLADPSTFQSEWLTEDAIEALTIGPNALMRHRPHVTRLITSLTLWVMDMRQRGTREEDGAAPAEEEYVHLIAARAVVRLGDTLRERVVLINPIHSNDWVETAIEDITTLGGAIVAGPELSEHHVGEPFDLHSMMTIRRRSSATDDHYIQRYNPRADADASR